MGAARSALVVVVAGCLCGGCPSSTPSAGEIAPEHGADRSAEPGTRRQREALFADIVAKTDAREAWSHVKNERLGLDWRAAAAALREEVAAARSDEDLYYALVKLSNARKDRHLKVQPADGGLDVPAATRERRMAPIRFQTDYSTPAGYFFFVSDLADVSADAPGLGHRVDSIDGIPVNEWVERQTPWFRHSTVDGLWWSLAEHIAYDRRGEGRPLDDAVLRVRLAPPDGEAYDVALPFGPRGHVPTFVGHGEPRYSGFAPASTTASGTLFVPTDARKVVVVQWHAFSASLQSDLDALMEEARARDLLDHDLVVDLTRGRGGAGSAWALQRFTGRRFEGTFGNIRGSDILPAFIDLVKRDDWDEPREHGLVDWLEGDCTRRMAAGEPYSATVPFKLFHLPADSDGTFDPHPVHFRGRLAVIMGPHGGSNLDQFGAIVVDNDLGFTIGTPLGGYSNTWEWTETLRFPETGVPVVRYMWTIGQTIRPSGEILEGNPAVPWARFPVTAENFRSYHDQAIARIIAFWQEGR